VSSLWQKGIQRRPLRSRFNGRPKGGPRHRNMKMALNGAVTIGTLMGPMWKFRDSGWATSNFFLFGHQPPKRSRANFFQPQWATTRLPWLENDPIAREPSTLIWLRATSAKVTATFLPSAAGQPSAAVDPFRGDGRTSAITAGPEHGG